MKARNVAKAIAASVRRMRQRHPDEEHFLSSGMSDDGQRVKVRKSHWPADVTIEVPTGSLFSKISQAVGADVIVGFEKGRRSLPFLKSVMGGARGAAFSPAPPITVDVSAWLQSNRSGGQNAFGPGLVYVGWLYPNATSSFWRLPTHTNSSLDEVGLRAIGLGRVSAPDRNWDTGDLTGSDPADVLITAWPQKNDSDEIKLCLGAWRVSDQVHLWTAVGSIFDPWENPQYPLQAKFFIDPNNGWGHVLPLATSNSPGVIYSACSRDVKYESTISRASGDGLNLANVSLLSYTPAPTEEVPTPPLESYLCCPATPQTSGSGQASVDFLKMDQSTGEWTSFASYDSADLPNGGDAVFPDCIPLGSETGSPVAIRGNEVVLVSSGGQLDLFDSAKWLKGHWTIRCLKPNGTNGTFLKSKTFTATDTPTLLDPGSMKAAVAAKPHPITVNSIPSQEFIGGLLFSEDTSSEYEHFGPAHPYFLPIDVPNMGRLSTIESRLAADHSGTRQWPTTSRNYTGGTIVDSMNTVWSAILEPSPILYGGAYSLVDNGTELAWRYVSSIQVTGSLPVSGEGYVADSELPAEFFLGSTPISLNPGDSVSGEVRDEDDNILYVYSASMGTTPETWTLDSWKWSQYHGCKWRTFLRGHTASGEVIEKDISQLIDAVTTKTLGKPTGEDVTVTQLNFEAPDNVWQIISLPDQGLVVLLRDLHVDNPDGNPSPHLEIWEISGLTLNKLSTTRLGSPDTQPFDGPTWLGGDLVWDAYSFGPPRMKACLNQDGVPQIVTMVGESKKIDPETDSGFKRVNYVVFDLTDPSSPGTNTVVLTSPDEGVGSSGDVPSDWPLWWEWDTLLLTAEIVAWIKDGKFRQA